MRVFFGDLDDWRTANSNYAVSKLVALGVCAMICGVCLGQRDLAAFASDLPRDQLQVLGFPRDPSSRFHHYQPPSESTFARMLFHVKRTRLQAKKLRCQDYLLGKAGPEEDQVSVDGEEPEQAGVGGGQRLLGQERTLWPLEGLHT